MSPDRRQLLLGGSALAAMAALPRTAGAQGNAPKLLLPALTNIEGRRSLSLDGPWQYILDPFDVAGRKPKSRRNFWEKLIETPATGLIEYEWLSSPVMQLPAAWNAAVPELTYYDGPVYFRRVFPASGRVGERHFLHFGAVNYAATVWLDGEEVGRHQGGFTPFSIEVTERLRRGAAHSLVVRADSRHGPATIPALDFDWKNYGGITRSVALVSTPAAFIQSSFVRLEGSEIVADVALNGAVAGEVVRLRIAELDVDVRGATDAHGRVRLAVPVPPSLTLWSPERPRLYDVRLIAGGDELVERIGFRTLAVRGRDILLNGAPVFLRGIALHEEAFGREGDRAVSTAEARALLAEAKALGCNFVRLAHYPHAAHTARLADELGLFVWAEIPVYWEEIAYENAATLALARNMMAELLARDANRASVTLWSVANETPQTPARTRFLRTLIADVRRADPTRLVTAALNKNVDVGGVRDGESMITVKDELAADLDVVAVNQYEGWYGKRTPAEIDQVSFASDYEKPLVFSEFGAGALYGHHGPREERWTEEYQAWLYEKTLKLVERTPGCAGLSPWLLKDFRSPRRWHGRFQELWNRKGLLSPDGRRKEAWYVLRDYYTAQAAADTEGS